MRVAPALAGELAAAWGEASAEASAAFGDGRLYLERLIEGGRHVEIQVLADRYGTRSTSASATARSSATTRS